MKIFEKFFGKKNEKNINEYPEDLKEEIESILGIKKGLNFEQKVPIIMQTHQIGIEPAIEMKQVIKRLKGLKKDYTTSDNKKVYYCYISNTKIFLVVENYSRMVNGKNKNVGEFISGVFLGGITPGMRALEENPMDRLVNFGPEPSHFDRMNMFELVLKIIEGTKSTIYRNDLGFDRIQFDRDDLEKYANPY